MGRIERLGLASLTTGERSRSFNQLTPARGLPHSFPAARFGLRRSNTWRLNNEQENVPAEQPSSREGARFPSSYAHPRRTRHPRCSSSQGSHRTLRVRPPVLAHANRITSGSDYKAVVRRGVRVVGPHTVAYLRRNPDPTPVRFGFIVAKNVGGAVVRNRVRRRLKAASFDLLPGVPAGTEVVFRALPNSVHASWPDLVAELSTALVKGQRAR
jgi:ribonuclease P protein component